MENYKKAFKEINEIFKFMPQSLLNKIPNSFKELILNEMDVQYEPNIKEPIEEVELLIDTKIILGLIYRDFLCSLEKREVLQQKDLEEVQKIKKELVEKQKQYDINKIFSRDIEKDINKEKKVNKTEVMAMQVVEEKWYKRIFNIIKNLFNK